MRVHVSEAHDLVAEMAFGCAATVCELVRSEAGKEEFGGCGFGWIAFLGDLEVTEAAENEFAWAGGGFVVSESGDGGEVDGT